MRAGAHFAGLFYPRAADELEGTVRALIRSAGLTAPVDGLLLGGMVPHAGYVYSGATAAATWGALTPAAPDTVVLLGPSHREEVGSARVWDVTGLQTPLGEVAADVEAATALAEAAGVPLGSPFAEHSLEVQLPFLQVQLPGTLVVAVTLGWPDPDVARGLARALAGMAAGRRILVVASSDLSHYHAVAEARVLDDRFRELLAAGDPGALFAAWRQREVEACGLGAVLTLLEVGQAAGASVHVLDQSDSSRAFGDTERVVGYLSAVVVREDTA